MRPIEPDDRPPAPAEDLGGRVIPLRPPGGEVVDAREISYEIALDDEPEQVHPPTYADRL